MTKELDQAIREIEKAHGKGSIIKLGSNEALANVGVISTGNSAIDRMIVIGGIPRGRITEIYGPEAGGKTTLTLQIIAQAQKSGGLAAFIDAEHSLDPNYARALGVDVDGLYVSQPDCGEQALEIVETLIKSAAFDVVVVDSVAALVPRSELEGEMGQPQMGLMARMMSQAMRKLTAVTHKSNTALVFINQIREKLNVMWGSPETTTGGRALKFYATLRLDVRRIAAIKKGDVVIGAKTKIKSAKNKLARPYQEIEIKLEYGKGFIDEITT